MSKMIRKLWSWFVVTTCVVGGTAAFSVTSLADVSTGTKNYVATLYLGETAVNQFETIKAAVQAWNEAGVGAYTIVVKDSATAYDEADIVFWQNVDGRTLTLRAETARGVTIKPTTSVSSRVFLFQGCGDYGRTADITFDGINVDVTGLAKYIPYYFVAGSGSQSGSPSYDKDEGVRQVINLALGGQYAHNITVKNCDLKATFGNANVAFQSEGGSSPSGLLVKDCTITGFDYVESAYFVAWSTRDASKQPYEVAFEGCTCTNKAFVNNQGLGSILVSGCTIDANKDYVIRTKSSTGANTILVTNTTVTVTTSESTGGVVVCRDSDNVTILDSTFVKSGGVEWDVQNLSGKTVTIKAGSYLKDSSGNIIETLSADKVLTSEDAGYNFKAAQAAQVISADGTTTNGYATLSEALEKVAEGQTIRLLENAAVASRIEISKSVTFDLNENVLSNTSGQVFYIPGGKTLTLRNGRVEGAAGAIETAAAYGIELVLDDVVISATGGHAVLWTAWNSVISLAEGSENAIYALSDNRDAIYTYNGYMDTFEISGSGILVVDGARMGIYSVYHTPYIFAEVYVSGSAASFKQYGDGENGVKGIRAGYYQDDVGAYCEDGYVCVANADESTSGTYQFVVRSAADINVILETSEGSVPYDTIAEAVAAAGMTAAKVVLNKNLAENLSVAEGQSIALHAGTNTLTGTISAPEGTLTILSGTFTSDPSAYLPTGAKVELVGDVYKVFGNVPYEDGAYRIRTLDDLVGFQYYVNVLGKDFAGETVSLEANIDMSSIDEWQPIGTKSASFAGTFEGNGKKLSGMTVVGDADVVGGLFRDIESGAEIRNLWFEGANVSGVYAGTLAHEVASGTIIDGIIVKADCTVTGTSYAGGIIACESNGDIFNCWNYATVSSDYIAAGIVGYIQGSSTDRSQMTNCVNKGTITGACTAGAGGIAVHANYADVSWCCNVGNVSSTSGEAGMPPAGIVCALSYYSVVSYCLNAGDVSGVTTKTDINVTPCGIVGHYPAGGAYPSRVEYSDNWGNITCTGYKAGGVGASLYGSFTMTYCRNGGTVTSTSNTAGGIAADTSSAAVNCLNDGALSGTSVQQLANSKTGGYYYVGDTLMKGDGSGTSTVEAALADLNNDGSPIDFWTTNAVGRIITILTIPDDPQEPISAVAQVISLDGSTTNEFATVQEAVGAVTEDGQTVRLVADVELAAAFDFGSHSITLDANGCSFTKGAGAGSVGNAWFLLGEQGTGSGKSFVLKNAVIDGFSDGLYLLWAQSCAVVIDNCTFTNNAAFLSGSDYGGIIECQSADMTITNSVFAANSSRLQLVDFNSSGEGGALTIADSLFDGNTCGANGVIYYADGEGVEIVDNTFANNVESGDEATVILAAAGVISGNFFTNNTVTLSSGDSRCALLATGSFSSGTGLFTGNAFVDNTLDPNASAANATVFVKGASDLSGNYWGAGEAPEEGQGADYAAKSGVTVSVDSYATAYEVNANGRGVTVTTAPISAGADIVIHEGGNVTYKGGSAADYSAAAYIGINKMGDWGDTVSAIRTEGNVMNTEGSITYTGVRGIQASTTPLSMTSIAGGIAITNYGFVGAIQQDQGAGNVNLQGIGDISVKAFGSGYGAKGFGIYSGTGLTDTFNVTANSLTVESESGRAYGIHGALANRHTTITITNAVIVRSVADAVYGSNLTAASPIGQAELNFGSLDISSENSFAYGLHCAGGVAATVNLDGNMTVSAPSSYVYGFRLAGTANFTVRGKDGKAIDVVFSSGADECDGAVIGGSGSTAKLDLTAKNFSVSSTDGDAWGLYFSNSGASFDGNVSNFSVSGKTAVYAIQLNGATVEGTFGAISATSSAGMARAICANGGTASILGCTNITAQGATESTAVYASSGAVVTLGAVGQMLSIAGDINVAAGATLNFSNAVALAGNVSNAGTMTFDRTGATGDKIMLIDYAGSEEMTLEKYGAVTLTGVSCYVLAVDGNDLVAVKVPTAALVVSADGATTNEFATLQAAVDAVAANGRIFLMDDNAESLVVGSVCAFTIDPNGHALTGSVEVTAEGFAFEIADGTCAYKAGVAQDVETTRVYATLKEAVDAGTTLDGHTIRMIANHTLSACVELDKSITLDLNGKTIDGDGKWGFWVSSAKNVIIDDASGDDSGTITHCYKGYNAGEAGAFKVISGTLTLNGGTLTENTTTFQGGAIFVDPGCTFTMNGGKIVNNTAPDKGGAVQSSGTFVMNGGVISGNSGTYGGGVILGGGDFTMTGGEIINNTATTKHGGGVYTENATNVTITGGFITNNTAYYHGGGVMVNKPESRLTIENCVIADNSCITADGGGIWSSAPLSITNSTISGNSACDWGGGIRAGSSVSIGDGVVISNNTTGGTGGGIFFDGDSPKAIAGDVVISCNVVTNGNGGAIGMRGGAVTLDAGVLIDAGNAASGLGNGIYVYYSSKFTQNNLLVTGGTYDADIYFAHLSDASVISNGAFSAGIACGNDVRRSGTVVGGIYTDGAKKATDEGLISDGCAFVVNRDPSTSAAYPWTIGPKGSVTFVLGDTCPAGAVAPANTNYWDRGTAWPLAKPTGYDAAGGWTFNGWAFPESTLVANEIPAGAFGDLMLTATWTQATVIQVKTNATAAADLPIKVTQTWIDENVEESKRTDEKAIQDKLNETDENGNMKWQNYVIGLDPTNNVAGVTEQNDDEKTVAVVANVEAPLADTGFTVKYSLDEVRTNGDVVVEGAATTSDNLDIDLDRVESNAFYKVNVIITKDDGGGEPTKIAATNTLGVLKVPKAPATAIVAVPWKDVGGRDVTVANLVKTATLTTNDMLYVYTKKGDYTTWVLETDGTWRATDESGGLAETNVVPRGSAVWLKRQDASKPIVLFGQAEGETVETTIEAATSPDEKNWNVIAAPTVEPVDLNEKFNEATKADVANDQVLVPTDGAPKNYTYEDGQWGYNEAVTVTNKTTGKVRVLSTRVTGDTKVPAGTGMWYLNGGSEKKVSW